MKHPLVRFSRQIMVGFLIGIAFTGCSVFMAMKGKHDPNMASLSIGQDRNIVIANLGQPSKTVMTGNVRVDVFRLERGNAPSGGRALAHGALDLFTLGLWEIAGTPIEAMQGEKFTLTIEYDENDKVKKVVAGDSTAGR